MEILHMDPTKACYHFRQFVDLVKHARVSITLIMSCPGPRWPTKLA